MKAQGEKPRDVAATPYNFQPLHIISYYFSTSVMNTSDEQYIVKEGT